MKRLPLLLVIAFAAGGCAEDELDRVSVQRPADTVVLASRDPGPGCCALDAIEVRSGRDDEPSSDTLRYYAARRGANYVVIDTFTVYDESTDTPVLTRARLFSCPPSVVAAAY
jgi:hypothetical protein